MALTAYEQALAGSGSDATRAVELVFKKWSSDAKFGRVSQNVASETALAIADFARLLSSFATELANDAMSVEIAWRTACRAHKLRGRQIPAENCPALLGRARGLADHAVSMARASHGALTAAEAKKLLLKHSGAANPPGLSAFLRDAPLGNHIVWATFDLVDTHADPFDRLRGLPGGVRTALGLGHFASGDTLIVLVWNHVDSGLPPLHRPTVADAEDSEYYQPHPDANAPWGLTEPLQPNPHGLQPQPEVVMPETTSRGLRLPFHVIPA